MKNTSFRVLIVDDESSIRDLLKMRLERRGHKIICASDGKEALEKQLSFSAEVAICDIRMPGMDGFEVLKELHIPTILVTGHGDKESAIKAVESGAFAFFEKPFDLDALEVSVKRAGERYQMEIEREELLKKLERLCELQSREIEKLEENILQNHEIGSCPAMLKIQDTLKRLALKPKATLLVCGETGTGKEVVAQELHRLTHDSRMPFLALNCAAIPTELFESELYGHEKGSFSGAHRSRIGLAEAVREGTLFLDEIGELAPQHQAKLLRLLQERKFRRVGSNHELEFKGRIIAATHRNLKERMSEELFREDLYYRLSIVELTLPPLRDRGEDIFTLAEFLCRKHKVANLKPELQAEMRSYNWPGNIRELNNWIERASILGVFDPILDRSQKLSQLMAKESNPSGISLSVNEGDLKSRRNQILDYYDKLWIEKALNEHRGNISATANALGIDRKNLARRIKELGLSFDDQEAA
ncbi:MAG: sigma-54-dependent Fis family transcriptional regulator [Proteobacteria bacterium]|nr:sigma-54-dependent Fis family transcriptional regulator [Pseudomonadota bacterium]